MTKVLVLGGGFSGVEAAIKLRNYGLEVTLVSNRDYLFVYPISIWIPVKKKRFDEVKIDIEKAQKFKDYFDWSESLSRIPSHRLLAILRAESEDFIRVKIEIDKERILQKM